MFDIVSAFSKDFDEVCYEEVPDLCNQCGYDDYGNIRSDLLCCHYAANSVRHTNGESSFHSDANVKDAQKNCKY